MRKPPTTPMHPDHAGVFDNDPEGARWRVARSLLRQGNPPEMVAKAVGLTLSQVRELALTAKGTG